jgi:molecular chaperone Hsp33
MNSFVQRFLFEDLPFRGAFVVLSDVWHTIAKQKEYPDGLREFLGEFLAGNILMTANIKLNGKITVQIQDNSKLDLIVSECTNDLHVRATAKFTKSAAEDTQIQYKDCLDGGNLVISIEAEQEGRLYQSIVALSKNESLAELLNKYMLQSEQLSSIFIFVYTDDKIVGFMLQQMPDQTDDLASDIKRIFDLANTLDKGELLDEEVPKVLHNLFNEDDIILFAPEEVNFRCTCSREKVTNMLRGLGKNEADNIILEEEIIKVNCDFCNTSYVYDKEDVNMIFSDLLYTDMESISKSFH